MKKLIAMTVIVVALIILSLMDWVPVWFSFLVIVVAFVIKGIYDFLVIPMWIAWNLRGPREEEGEEIA